MTEEKPKTLEEIKKIFEDVSDEQVLEDVSRVCYLHGGGYGEFSDSVKELLCSCFRSGFFLGIRREQYINAMEKEKKEGIGNVVSNEGKVSK